MSSVSQEDEFVEVTHKRKKRKASGSPTLPTLQKTGSSELPPGTPTRPKPAIIKNKIPVILSGIKAEHKNWRKLLGELRQFHPGLKVSQIKELPKGDFLLIGDSMQDVIILQNESKMKAALGQNVKVSLPKAFQINKQQTKSLAVKGVPSDISDSEFKEFLELKKINFAKAECLKSKKDGRVLPIFRLEISDPTEARLFFPKIPTLQKTGSSELPPGTPTRPKPAIIKNKIPVILSGIKAEHKNWRKLLGELRQFHPGLKVSQIKELPKGDFLLIGDSMQDVIILQNESKMKAALGQNVKVSLPKAFQINKQQTKSLAVKGVPSDISDSEFKEFLELKKINFAKAECLKSKKDGRVLPIFRLEISDPTEARLFFPKI